jgi:hypothetical protein
VTRLADLIGAALCGPLIWCLEAKGRITDALELWLGASRNPDDPDESDAAAASPVADYRSNA